jgi:hypothetical protein
MFLPHRGPRPPALPIHERTPEFCRLLDEWMPADSTGEIINPWALRGRSEEIADVVTNVRQPRKGFDQVTDYRLVLVSSASAVS